MDGPKELFSYFFLRPFTGMQAQVQLRFRSLEKFDHMSFQMYFF